MYIDNYQDVPITVVDSYLYDNDIYTSYLPLNIGVYSVNVTMNGRRLISVGFTGLPYRGTYLRPTGIKTDFTWDGYPDEGGDLASEVNMWTPDFNKDWQVDENMTLDITFDNVFLAVYRVENELLVNVVNRSEG